MLLTKALRVPAAPYLPTVNRAQLVLEGPCFWQIDERETSPNIMKKWFRPTPGMRKRRPTWSGWRDWGFLSVRSWVAEGNWRGWSWWVWRWSSEVQNEDLACLNDSVTVLSFFKIFLMLTAGKTVWLNLHVITTFTYVLVQRCGLWI